MSKLTDRVAIVTGGGIGIGEVCAKHLTAEGAKVAVADIDLPGATRVAAEIRAAGGDARAFHVDISSEPSVVQLYSDVLAHYGRLDVLHNNAAATAGEQFFRDAGIGEMDVAIWDRAFAVNTRGTMLMIKHAIAPMLKAGGGSIINTSSSTSLAADYYSPAYASSKAAINVLTKYVAMQYGKRNIRCNAIAPGLILTPTAQTNNKKSDLASVEDNTMVPYLGRPEDVAAIVVFLASDASRLVTSQVLCIDGGYTAHMAHAAALHEVFLAHPASRPRG
jgi:NAD(P)-dependent dehydrogenase (short-subunit alcohol dehydrogenase family)